MVPETATMALNDEIYVNAIQTRQLCGNISEMTLHRWLKDVELEFPRPVRINHRRYWRLGRIRAFWARQQEVA